MCVLPWFSCITIFRPLLIEPADESENDDDEPPDGEILEYELCESD